MVLCLTTNMEDHIAKFATLRWPNGQQVVQVPCRPELRTAMLSELVNLYFTDEKQFRSWLRVSMQDNEMLYSFGEWLFPPHAAGGDLAADPVLSLKICVSTREQKIKLAEGTLRARTFEAWYERFGSHELVRWMTIHEAKNRYQLMLLDNPNMDPNTISPNMVANYTG